MEPYAHCAEYPGSYEKPPLCRYHSDLGLVAFVLSADAFGDAFSDVLAQNLSPVLIWCSVLFCFLVLFSGFEA